MISISKARSLFQSFGNNCPLVGPAESSVSYKLSTKQCFFDMRLGENQSSSQWGEFTRWRCSRALFLKYSDYSDVFGWRGLFSLNEEVLSLVSNLIIRPNKVELQKSVKIIQKQLHRMAWSGELTPMARTLMASICIAYKSQDHFLNILPSLSAKIADPAAPLTAVGNLNSPAKKPSPSFHSNVNP